MKRFFMLLLGISLFLGSTVPSAYSDDALSPLEESPAYQRFVRGPRTEMAKLLFILDRFHNTGYTVTFNGATYDANTAIRLGRNYLRKFYGGEKADEWLKIHAYHAGPDGKLIYIKYPSGKRRPMAEVFLEELGALNQAQADRPAPG